ncbi:probable protein phosphatase 2C member 13, mitochondrial isoform X2 [Olea europaea var. sylvestris]|uniref:probable protein phosphatase 2C member 13, mitochondrial isoform X2 n=1 Tax=Olea europaea var. sylvestris TaxID=158386 RepID=UPI000C1D8958|nr:probable protein phosphatase 2C member 13, mitochondrial isoform X2 [Olea europaea var. sylvestris]
MMMEYMLVEDGRGTCISCAYISLEARLLLDSFLFGSEDGRLSCGYSSFRGKRASMEDFYDIKTSKVDGQTVCLFGIFDGHGGSRAAEYLKEHLFENLMKHPEFITNTKLAISETYQQTDRDFLESEKDTFRDDGSTASTAVLVGNHLYVANVGDSRTIISKDGKAIPLSEDHKPNRSDERKRIENAGGVVMWAGTWRVGGVLAMSRAFGNRMLKQFVVAEPEIQDQEIDQELELLVLASDGLWDVVPNEDAISLAQIEDEPKAAARKLTETAFTRGSADNITCIVVRFHHETTVPEETHQSFEANYEETQQTSKSNTKETLHTSESQQTFKASTGETTKIHEPNPTLHTSKANSEETQQTFEANTKETQQTSEENSGETSKNQVSNPDESQQS